MSRIDPHLTMAHVAALAKTLGGSLTARFSAGVWTASLHSGLDEGPPVEAQGHDLLSAFEGLVSAVMSAVEAGAQP